MVWIWRSLVEISGDSISFWIRKGDLNEHYDGNKNPIQSFLFCIKA
jgi:hypothetical protein